MIWIINFYNIIKVLIKDIVVVILSFGAVLLLGVWLIVCWVTGVDKETFKNSDDRK